MDASAWTESVAPVSDLDLPPVFVRMGLRRLIEPLDRHRAAAFEGTDHEAVHQLRVGARRLRTMVRMYRREVGPLAAAWIRSELRWFGQVVGMARDWYVIQAHVASDLRAVQADEASTSRILGALAEGRRDAQEKLVAALESARYRDVRRRLGALLGELPAKLRSPEARSEKRAGRRHCRQAIDRVLVRWRAGEGELCASGLHPLRVDLKRLRYTCESFPVLRTAEMRSCLRHLQTSLDCLGAHQDAVVVQERLLALAADSAGWTAQDRRTFLVLGRLVELRRGRADDERRRFGELWPKLPRRLKRLRRTLR